MMQIKKILSKYNGVELSCVPYGALSGLLPCRKQRNIPNGAKSVIVVLFPYKLKSDEKRNISRYAVVNDYHKVAGGILSSMCSDLKYQFSNNSFVWFCDDSPVKEVEAACLAGLGVLGINGLIINKRFGSFCFVGEIVTDLEIKCEVHEIMSCSKCMACVRGCPGGALCDGDLKKESCVSYVSQKKGELTKWETEILKSCGLVWGCDRCSDVCPHNKNIETTEIDGFLDEPVFELTTDNVEKLYKDRAFGYRGISVLKRNISIIYNDYENNK